MSQRMYMCVFMLICVCVSQRMYMCVFISVHVHLCVMMTGVRTQDSELQRTHTYTSHCIICISCTVVCENDRCENTALLAAENTHIYILCLIQTQMNMNTHI